MLTFYQSEVFVKNCGYFAYPVIELINTAFYDNYQLIRYNQTLICPWVIDGQNRRLSLQVDAQRNNMEIAELGSHLAALSGIDIAWKESTAVMVMADKTALYLEYLAESDELYIYGYVHEVKKEQVTRIGMSLLEANLFGKETGGAVIAYDTEGERLVLWTRMRMIPNTLEDLQERLSCIYLSLIHWTGKLRMERDSHQTERVGIAAIIG